MHLQLHCLKVYSHFSWQTLSSVNFLDSHSRLTMGLILSYYGTKLALKC